MTPLTPPSPGVAGVPPSMNHAEVEEPSSRETMRIALLNQGLSFRWMDANNVRACPLFIIRQSFMISWWMS